MEQNQSEKPKISDEELERIEKEEKKRGFRVRDVRSRETKAAPEKITETPPSEAMAEIEKKPSEPEGGGSREKPPAEKSLEEQMAEAMAAETAETEKKPSRPEEILTQEEIDSLLDVFRKEPSAGEVSVSKGELTDKDLVVKEETEAEGIESLLGLGGEDLLEAFSRLEEKERKKSEQETAAETPSLEGARVEEEPILREGREEVPLEEPETGKEILEKIIKGKGIAEQNYATALAVLEKADKNVKKLTGLRRFFASKEEILKTDAAVEEFKKRQDMLADGKKSLNEILSLYRQELLRRKDRELMRREAMGFKEAGKELKEYAKQLMIETTVNEAIIIYNLKKEKEIEISAIEEGKLAWLKTKGLEAAQWYRKQSGKQKILVAGALLGTGVAAGIAGGAIGAALAGGALAGRWTQRILSGAGTAVGMETLIKSQQEKAAKRKMTKKLEKDLLFNVGKEGEMNDFFRNLDKTNEVLNEKLFDLLGRRKKEERIRYALAAAAGLVVGSGALSRAFREIVPDEWRHAVMEKLHLAHHETPVTGQAPVSHEAVTLEEAKQPLVMRPEGPLVAPPDVWGQINGIEEAYKGDSVWKMLERQIDARMGDNFDSLDKAQKFYIIDALKDKVAADPGKFGLIDIVDIDKIPVGQRIDFSEIFQDRAGVNDIVSKAINLRPEQLENILKESEAFRKGLAAGVTETTIEPDEFGPASTPTYGTPLGPTSVPEQIIQSGTPAAAPPPRVPEQLGKGTVPGTGEVPPVENPPASRIPTVASPDDQIPSDETHQVEKFEVKSEELPDGVRKEEVSGLGNLSLTGQENLNMEKIGKLFNSGKIQDFDIRLLRDQSRTISFNLDQLKKLDPTSERAKMVKSAIKIVVKMNEGKYSKGIFSKEVYEAIKGE